MHAISHTVSFGMLSATSSILARKLSDGSLKLCPHVHEENSNQVNRCKINPFHFLLFPILYLLNNQSFSGKKATNSRRWRHVEVPDVFPSTQLEHVQRISLQVLQPR
jgi:hypothetical protein